MGDGVTMDDGTRLNVRIDGREDGRPLLLSNSIGTDLTMWDAQIAALAPHFHIARYDTRGHGASDAPPGNYTINRLGRDALAIADHLGWDRFGFAGVSMGGMTGLWLGINAPGRLDRAVIANGAAFAGGSAGWADRIAQVRAGGMAAIADLVVARWFTPDFAARHPDAAAAVRQVFLATPPAGYVGCCAALGAIDLRAGLSGIAVPLLFIGGAHDTTPPPSVIHAMAAQVPGAAATIVEAAHLSNIEAADAFTRAMLEFLSQ